MIYKGFIKALLVLLSVVLFIGLYCAIDSNLQRYNNQIEKSLDELDVKKVEKKTDVNIYVNQNEKDVNYMYGIATAYTPSYGGINSDTDPTVTSTMKPAKNGVIAVNPNVIPYGSEVMIIHNGTVIRGQAQDTGGAMRQNKNQVDILIEDYERALEWGRKEVHIIWW